MRGIGVKIEAARSGIVAALSTQRCLLWVKAGSPAESRISRL